MKVLFLHPKTLRNQSLNIEEELNRLKSAFKIQKGSELKTIPYGSLPQIQADLNSFQPDVIHFSGHGTPFQAIQFQEDKNGNKGLLVKTEDFAEMLSGLTINLKVLILNSCFTGISMSAAIDKGVKCVIGMEDEIPDTQAINFADSFYRSILRGEKVVVAFKLAAICAPKGKPKIEWIGSELPDYRLVEPVKPEFDKGDEFFGRRLDEIFAKDKFNGLWQVSDPQFSDVPASLYRVFTTGTFKDDFITAAEKVGKLTNLFKDKNKEGILTVNRIYGRQNPLVIEYDGIDFDEWRTLEEYMKQSPVPLDDAIFKEISLVILKIARILSIGYSAQEKYIHGILSPDSVILRKNETSIEVKLTDFGLNKLISRDFINQSSYIPPNRKEAHQAIASDDVYAVGKIWNALLLSSLELEVMPEDNFLEWFKPLESVGMDFSQGKFLASCISDKVDLRPQNIIEFLQKFNDLFGDLINEDAGNEMESIDVSFDPNKPPSKFTNSLGMTFVLVPPGNFLMGSSPEEQGKFKDETLHRVWLNRPFYISETVVTNDQYAKLIGEEKKRSISSFLEFVKENQEEFPIINIAFANKNYVPLAWEDAVRFCLRLTDLPNERLEHGRTYRLPTEAEWEYCCRAGSVTSFSSGEELSPRSANYKIPNKSGGIKPAKTYFPNAFGIYQMHGNVWEYCSDIYGANYYRSGENINPTGPKVRKLFFNTKKTARVIRGGDFLSPMENCRSAARAKIITERPGGSERTAPRVGANTCVGFRVICEVPGLFLG